MSYYDRNNDKGLARYYVWYTEDESELEILTHSEKAGLEAEGYEVQWAGSVSQSEAEDHIEIRSKSIYS